MDPVKSWHTWLWEVIAQFISERFQYHLHLILLAVIFYTCLSGGQIGALAAAPTSTSINPSSSGAGTFELTINGSNFDSGAVDQVYTPTGAFMGQGAVKSRSATQIVVVEYMNGAGPGNYIVNVKNSDGQESNGVTLTITNSPIVPTDRFLTYLSPDPYGDPTRVYWIQNNKRYHVIDPNIIDIMRNNNIPGWSWQGVYTTSNQYTLALDFISTGSASNGLYIRLYGGTDVYKINNGLKEYVSSAACQQVNCWPDVLEVPQVYLNMFLPIQLPKTGQTTCYDTAGTVIPCAGTGQDGDIQAGVAWPNPRFIDNNDGTITDKLTGLIWTKYVYEGFTNWQGDLNFVAGMNAGTNRNFGYTDWRLPNILELYSLIDSENWKPALPIGYPFTNTNIRIFSCWSSTTDVYWSSTAWSISMDDGYLSPGGFKSGYLCFWPVRSGQIGTIQLPRTGQTLSYALGDDGALKQGILWPIPRFIDNANGTVTDNLTGLIWTKSANLTGTYKTWQGALDYVKGMNTGTYPNFGYTDWRLPNYRELQSLTDKSRINPALPWGHPFISVQIYIPYWSSTSRAASSSNAWNVFMYSGGVSYGDKSSGYGFLWPIRGGQVGLTVHSLLGQVTVNGVGLGGVTLSLTSATNSTTTTTSDGTYSFTGLPDGNYTITPSLSGYTFTPASKSIIVAGADVTDADFTASLANRPPVLDSIGYQSINEGSLLTFTISGSDPDGDSLTYGTSQLPSGASFDPVTRVFSWTPDYAQAGLYSVTFTVSDGSLTDSETIAITVNNVPAPDFIVTIIPESKYVIPGESVSYLISVESVNGFNELVDFTLQSVSPLDSTITVDFSPTAMLPGFVSLITVKTTNSTNEGTYSVSILASGGDIKHVVSITLTVNATPPLPIPQLPPSIVDIKDVAKEMLTHKEDVDIWLTPLTAMGLLYCVTSPEIFTKVSVCGLDIIIWFSEKAFWAVTEKIANDPIDENYQEIITPRFLAPILPFDDSTMAQARANYVTALMNNNIILHAILVTMERLQGAIAADEPYFIRLQAASLKEYLQKFYLTQEELRDALLATGLAFDEFYSPLYDTLDSELIRISIEGFSIDEKSILMKAGLTQEDIQIFEGMFSEIDIGSDLRSSILDGLDQWVESINNTILQGIQKGIIDSENLIEWADAIPPEIIANFSIPANDEGWHNIDVSINFLCVDDRSGIIICPNPITVTTEGTGQVVTGTAFDAAGNSASASVIINLDKTPPTIAVSLSTPPNAFGWHNSDVTVTFTCSDALSGIATCPAPVIVSTEGAGQVITGTALDVAGNSASTSVTINLDKTSPSIEPILSSSPNAAGWHNSDVTVSFICSDDESGIATCPDPAIVSTEGRDQIIAGTTTDKAGNGASSYLLVSLDKTPPVLTMPALAPAYLYNASVVFNFNAQDTLSMMTGYYATLNGMAISNEASITLTKLGTNTFTLTATDMAGNTSTQTSTFEVQYAFLGFLPPIQADGSKVFKLGSTIPIKFQLQDFNNVYISTANATLTLQQYSNDTPMGDPIVVESTSGADTGNMFRYDYDN